MEWNAHLPYKSIMSISSMLSWVGFNDKIVTIGENNMCALNACKPICTVLRPSSFPFLPRPKPRWNCGWQDEVLIKWKWTRQIRNYITESGLDRVKVELTDRTAPKGLLSMSEGRVIHCISWIFVLREHGQKVGGRKGRSVSLLVCRHCWTHLEWM